MANRKRSEIDKIKFLEEEIKFLQNQQKYINASSSLYDFLKTGFDHVETHDFRDSRLAGALCEHLEAVMAGQIKRLIINISPRTMKTLLTGVYFPAYWWLKKPHLKFIYCSYTFDIAKVCSEKFRNLVKHDYYNLVQNSMEEYIDYPLKVISDNEKYLLNSYRGDRSTVGIGGSITGKGADVIILDDPLKASEAKSKKVNTRTNQFIGETLISRFDKTSEEKVLILIQQRLKEDDTSGYLREMGGFDVLELPLLFTGMSNSKTALGFKDWRKTTGEILVPELLTIEEIRRMEIEMTSIEFERQCQQNVKGVSGNVISNKYFKEYQNAPPYDQYILAADLAESVEDDACFTGLVVFGIYEGKYYVVDVIEKRLGFDDQILEVKKLLAKYPISYKLIEKKSMGAALIHVLSKEIPGVIALEPKDYGNEKENRLKATLPSFMAGKIYFPTEESCEKITNLKDQIVTFPLTRYDDIMDAFVYGVLWLERNSKSIVIEESMTNISEHTKQRRSLFIETSPSKLVGRPGNGFGSAHSSSRFKF